MTKSMTSPCGRRNKHPLPTAILFFKIILRTSLADGKLKIPNNFTRKYGGALSNPVFLKPPDGTEWKVYWTKHGGEIWFQEGWENFARYYSLDHGHLVLFEYEGPSNFDVHIFDMSALEIDYTSHVTHNEKGQISEDSVEILDEQFPCQKTRLKSTVPSPQPHKKMRTSKTSDAENSSNPQNLPQHVQSKGSKSKGTNFDMPTIASIKQELDEDMGGGIFIPECPKVEQLTSTKIAVTSITTRTFRSKNPSFIVVMKPLHINLYSLKIPLEIAEKYMMKKGGAVLLEALDGRTWSATYSVRKIKTGWHKFASDNNLNVGDVCVFELIKRKQSLCFRVFIFQVAKEPSCSLSQGGNASQITSLSSSCCPGTIKSLKEAEKFTSENPLFMVNIRENYLRKTTPYVPCLFVRKYFGKKTRTVIMQFGNKLWPVSFLYDTFKVSGKFSIGWSLFAEESKLQAGDVCIFELINKENAVLSVHVFRGHS